MRRTLVIVLSIIVTLAAGLFSVAPASASNNLTITLQDSLMMGIGDTPRQAMRDCIKEASRNMGEIQRGTRIRIANENGRTVGTGALRWKRVGKVKQGSLGYEVDCMLTARIRIQSAQFYAVTVGRSNAGEYSARELRKNQWRLNLGRT